MSATKCCTLLQLRTRRAGIARISCIFFLLFGTHTTQAGTASWQHRLSSLFVFRLKSHLIIPVSVRSVCGIAIVLSSFLDESRSVCVRRTILLKKNRLVCGPRRLRLGECLVCGLHKTTFVAKHLWGNKWRNLFTISDWWTVTHFKKKGTGFIFLQNQQDGPQFRGFSLGGCRLIVSKSSRSSWTVSLLRALFCPDADRGDRGCA